MTNNKTETAGKPWGEQEKNNWLAQQTVKRSYADDVLTVINELKHSFDIEQYGSLSYDPQRFPLFGVRTRNWDKQLPTVLITGGVHGYETSGVHGALGFIKTKATHYSQYFNLVITPCISPWGYETINRWNPYAVDPNRSFCDDSPSEEAALVMSYVRSLEVDILAHIDLHETTDTDNTTFRPALAARDGVVNKNWNIPDGFYTVGNTSNPQPAFQKAIIDSVKKVTHIAPPDSDGKIIGVKPEQEGVINYDMFKLNLCGGFTRCDYATTTEVYPDSPKVTNEECNLAQIAAVTGGLDYLISQVKS